MCRAESETMEWEFKFSVFLDGPYEQLGAAGGMTWEGAARNLAREQGRRLGYGFYRIRLLADDGRGRSPGETSKEAFSSSTPGRSDKSGRAPWSTSLRLPTLQVETNYRSLLFG
jgi:hypothetical protein